MLTRKELEDLDGQASLKTLNETIVLSVFGEKMIIKEISLSDTLALRSEILRPDKDVSDCVFESDHSPSARHFGALDERGNIVGVVSVHRNSNPLINADHIYQIRAMATSVSYRGTGVGRLLLNAVEGYVISTDATLLWANARSSAVGFYLKAGYKVVSEEFNIKDIGPHFLVMKNV